MNDRDKWETEVADTLQDAVDGRLVVRDAMQDTGTVALMADRENSETVGPAVIKVTAKPYFVAPL